MADLLDFLRSIFDLAPPVHQGPIENARAFQIMRRLNQNALTAIEGGCICMIEDHADPDGRMFRLEYQSTPDGRHAVAWCRPTPGAPVGCSHNQWRPDLSRARGPRTRARQFAVRT